jgi:uncharacterized coiled-coil protein SlyX
MILMAVSSKSDLINKIQAEYHKRLKELESKLAIKHKELTQIEHLIKHEEKKTFNSNLSSLKSKRRELNAFILKLKKDVLLLNKEKKKKLRKL